MLKLSRLLLVLLPLGGCSHFIFFPNSHQYITPAQLHLQNEDVYFSSHGARLHGWWLHAEHPPKGTIVFLHGNAENISSHIGSVYWLPQHGYDVFLFDYRGYGLSEGSPDLAGVHQDFAAALDYVFTRTNVDTKHIFIFGQSLGAAIALVGTASSPYKNQLRAVIVEGAFSSYRLLAREKLASSWLTWLFQWPLSYTISDAFRPIDTIANISPTPVLLIHSESDEVIPIHHARDLFAAAKEPKSLWLVKNIPHIQTLNKPEYQQQLLDYLHAHNELSLP